MNPVIYLAHAIKRAAMPDTDVNVSITIPGRGIHIWPAPITSERALWIADRWIKIDPPPGSILAVNARPLVVTVQITG